MANLVRVGGGSKKNEDLWLIKDGVVNSNYHFNSYAYTRSYWSSATHIAPTVTQHEGYISFKCDANGLGCMAFAETIDFSQYKSVNVTFKTSIGGSFYSVFTIANELKDSFSFISSGYQTYILGTSYHTQKLDLSSIYDMKYLIFETIDRDMTFDIKDIWLEKRDITYLYKDGTQNVAWDNGVYSAAEVAYVNYGGYDELSNYLFGSFKNNFPNMNSITIVTDKSIDFSQYSKLKVRYLQDTTESEFEIDVSDVNTSNYFGLSMIRYNSTYYFIADINVYKENINSQATVIKEANISSTSTYDIYISRVWLEK